MTSCLIMSPASKLIEQGVARISARMERKSTLLTLSLLSWMLYSAVLQVPVVSSKFPLLRIPSRIPDSAVGLPSSQLLVLFIALSNIIFFYFLYSSVVKGTLQLVHSVAFLISSFLMVSGVSMHSVVVIVENGITQSDPIFPLVDVLHEYVSHSTTMTGFYAMMSIIIWGEYRSLMNDIQTRKEKKFINSQSSIWAVFVRWVFPVIILGPHLAVFSFNTSTSHITMCFFISVILLAFKFNKDLRSYGAPTMLPQGYQYYNEVLLINCFFIASLSGLLVLFLLYFKIVTSQFS